HVLHRRRQRTRHRTASRRAGRGRRKPRARRRARARAHVPLMRTAVLLLILANVILFGYARLDRVAQSEAGRLGAQVQPDRIRVLTSQQVAALAPGKVAALADVCVEWGPFSDVDRARAQADIE